MRLHYLSSILLLFVLAIAGCGGNGKDYKFHSGKGKIAGKIPEGSYILFFPEGDSNFVAKGKIDADGTFTLKTSMVSPDREVSGVPEGEYATRIQIADSMKEIGYPELPKKVHVGAGADVIEIKLSKSN